MALKIRLTRMGAKKNPFYRIVAIDSRKARDGEYLEQIGYYDPKLQPANIKIDAEIAKKWLAVGAQPTETVRNIFVNAGIMAGKAYKGAVKAEEETATASAVDVAVEAAVTKLED